MDMLQGAIPRESLISQLDKNDRGDVKNTRNNCAMIFRHDEVLYGKIKFNALTQRIDIVGDVPWVRSPEATTVTNSDLRGVRLYVENNYGITIEKYIDEGLALVADENQYHPIRDYLNDLPPWDGTERVRYALHKFLGADVSDYSYELLKVFMLGAVSRVFKPGIKFDYILCLVGSQGVGKSTFFRYLAVKDDWFSDDLKNIESDGVYQKLQGHWIIEMSEMMGAINARTNEAIKSFLSRQKETFRTPYDKLPEDRPRQCVFGGTTNKLQFLPADKTGNRRFLPILCHENLVETPIMENEKESRAYIEQMWAEIMILYRKEHSLKFSPKMQMAIAEAQQIFVPEDTDAGLILTFMQETKEDKVCSKMLFCEALGNYNQPQRWQTNEICETVNQLIKRGDLSGWKAFNNPRRFKRGYGTQKGWERVDIYGLPKSDEYVTVEEPDEFEKMISTPTVNTQLSVD